VVLSIYSEFYQIGTPHFSLEGVVLATWLGHIIGRIIYFNSASSCPGENTLNVARLN